MLGEHIISDTRMVALSSLICGCLALTPHASMPRVRAHQPLQRIRSSWSSMTNVVAAREGDDAGKPPRALLNVEGGSPQGTGRRPYVVLCACVLLYLNNQWARQLPSYLVNFNALDPATAGAGSSSAHELINVQHDPKRKQGSAHARAESRDHRDPGTRGLPACRTTHMSHAACRGTRRRCEKNVRGHAVYFLC